MQKAALFSLLATATLLALGACTQESSTAPPQEPAAQSETPGNDLREQVSRMGAIGYSYRGVFSPAGERVAFVSNASGVPNVWLTDVAGSKPQQLTDSDDQVGSVLWSPNDDTLAIDIAPGGGLNTQIYLLPAAGGEKQIITEGGNTNNWPTRWSDDGRYLNFSSSADSANGMDCWVYDTETGESRLIVKNQGIGWCILSPDNRFAVAGRMVNRGETNLHLVDIESREEQLLTPHEGVALSGSPLFLDENTLVFSTNVGRDMAALARLKITDGVAGPLEILVGRNDAELSSMDKLDDSRLLLNWNQAGSSQLAIYDVSKGATTAGPDLPADIAGSPEVSADGKRALMTISGATRPSDVWLLDIESGKFSQLSQTPHDGVDLDSLVRPALKTYLAHDGLELSGWLYLPDGFQSPGPMVLSFHGGPEGQERPRFRATYQALLSRGIAVFAPNVRGSSGFGKTFVNLDNGELRFDGIRDIAATVKFVTEAGLADPARIGIMGGSYGGYMVMAGITEYPEMFAAGANLFGIVNFETFFAQTEPWMAAISTIEYGDPVTQADLLARLSPIHRIDRIVTPTIVLHGANDTNVPVVEAEQVVDNLKARDVPVKYVLFEDEGHGWRKIHNRVTSSVEIVGWFEQYLK